MCVILIKMPCEGRSQGLNPNDTICFRIDIAQNLLILAKQKPICDSIAKLLQDKVVVYETIVKQFVGKDSLNADIKTLFQSEIKTLQEQKAVYEGQILVLNKQIKRWKRKTRWTAIAGVAATAGVLYLFIQK